MRWSVFLRRGACAATILLIASSALSFQTDPRATRVPIGAGQARLIERHVADLAPTLRATTAAPSSTAVVMTPIVTTLLPPATATAAPPPRPVIRELQLVRPSRALEGQINQALVSQVLPRRVIAGGGAVLPLPGILRQLDETGEVVQLKAYVLAGRRLIFDAAQHLFTGTIYVGVSDIVQRPPRDLGTPISFSVIGAEQAEPSEVQIERTSTPREIAIRVAAAPSGATIRIASYLTPEGLPINLPLRPVLMIEPGSTSIEGLGLETTDVNVTVVGLGGSPAPPVSLSSTSGFLSRTRIPIDAQGIGSATIRSGLGTGRITASSPGLSDSTTEVAFRLPYLTAVASLLGGLIGGAVRLLSAGPRRLRLYPMLAAIGTGILVFALYAGGINVLPFTPTVTVGAVLVFAVSGAGAFLGSRLLSARGGDPPGH